MKCWSQIGDEEWVESELGSFDMRLYLSRPKEEIYFSHPEFHFSGKECRVSGFSPQGNGSYKLMAVNIRFFAPKKRVPRSS